MPPVNCMGTIADAYGSELPRKHACPRDASTLAHIGHNFALYHKGDGTPFSTPCLDSGENCCKVHCLVLKNKKLRIGSVTVHGAKCKAILTE